MTQCTEMFLFVTITDPSLWESIDFHKTNKNFSKSLLSPKNHDLIKKTYEIRDTKLTFCPQPL